MTVIAYEAPRKWISYDPLLVASELVEAKAAVLSLQTMPFQRSWVDSLQQIELKREVAGTSRIEGAVFTDRELDVAMKETPEQLETRSQKQAHAAMQTYRWIASLPSNMPITADLVRGIHMRIVRGADDDHCQPGQLRKVDENVTFGAPRHRGVEGGEECAGIFAAFVAVIQGEFTAHDSLIRAISAHYHIAAMHPFLDGNGRTARALEALLLQRSGLRDACFIAMSNYYYDEKTAYLSALNEVRAKNHDLTPFLVFALKGIALQAKRLLAEIRRETAKVLFRNLMYDLFHRLKSPRKRVIALRQIEILKILLESDVLDLHVLFEKASGNYAKLRNSWKAYGRDLNELISLDAIRAEERGQQLFLSARLEWPAEITAAKFFERLRTLPKAKTHSFLR